MSGLVLSGCDAWGRPIVGASITLSQSEIAKAVIPGVLSTMGGFVLVGGIAKLLGASLFAALGLGTAGAAGGYALYKLATQKPAAPPTGTP